MSDVPLDFLQGRVPRLAVDTLRPIAWAPDRDLDWCPPGHGDLYVSLRTSGMLDRLLADEIERSRPRLVAYVERIAGDSR